MRIATPGNLSKRPPEAVHHKGRTPKWLPSGSWCGLPSGGSNSMIDRYMAKWTIA